MGIQTIICTLLMEWRFSRGLNPASWRAVGFSTMIGGYASCTLTTYFGVIPIPVGLVVGCIMGLLIRLGSRARSN